MGLGPIPYSARESYALNRGMARDLVEHFCEVIGAMDEAYRDWLDKAKPPPPAPRPEQDHRGKTHKSGRA